MNKNNSDIAFVKAFQDNYIWILIDQATQSAICVDPGEASPLLDFLSAQQLRLEAILLTHHHADHSGGILELLKLFPEVNIYGCYDTRLNLDPAVFRKDRRFRLHNFHFEVLNTAGHTNSHVCFFETSKRFLFSGDTLFSAGCGRIFDGNAEALFSSLQALKNLPPETKMFCGHEYTEKNLRFAAVVEPSNLHIQTHLKTILEHPRQPTLPSTIGLEKEINPFFRLDKEAVIAYALSQGCRSPDPFSVFKQLRHDKDFF